MSEIQGIAPPDNTPGKAVPIPHSITPHLPSSPRSPTPSVKYLQQWLPLYLKRTDRLMSHLDRVLSTPSGTDTILMTLCYSSLTASSLLSRLSLYQLRISARRLISLATSLPVNTTILISSGQLQTPRLMRLSQSLKALSALISDFRIFVRLWGILGLWKWGKKLLEDPPKDLIFKRIAWAQVAVNIAFQVLENGAYLSSKGVLGWDAKRQGKAWAWSSRFWAAHIALDFLRLARERRIYKEKGKAKEGAVDTETAQVWKRQAFSNLAFAPLTLHWSFEQGILSDLWIGTLGTAAGAAAFTQLWKRTA